MRTKVPLSILFYLSLLMKPFYASLLLILLTTFISQSRMGREYNHAPGRSSR